MNASKLRDDELRILIARAIWPVNDEQWNNDFFKFDKRDAFRKADQVLAAFKVREIEAGDFGFFAEKGWFIRPREQTDA